MNIDNTDILYKIGVDISEELQVAIETHGLFTSAHHGYAIILEELDELWDEVRKKKSVRDVKNMRTEAVQVAAMAMKFIMSMDADWKPTPINKVKPMKGDEEELKKIEQKCQRCLYDVVTKEVLDELGSDPCDTCGADCRNWKPKVNDIKPECSKENCKESCPGWNNCDKTWTKEVPVDAM